VRRDGYDMICLGVSMRWGNARLSADGASNTGSS
jgi:hypothetical protein